MLILLDGLSSTLGNRSYGSVHANHLNIGRALTPHFMSRSAGQAEIERTSEAMQLTDELEPSYADWMARSEPKGVNYRGFWEFREAPDVRASKAAKTPKTGPSKTTPCKPGDPMSVGTGCYPRSHSSACLEGIL